MEFSFIIPAFNEEDYIGRCINSIKTQEDDFCEIIVVDNKSTDKTAQIAKNLGCKVVKEKKRGISPARNKGARVAGGNYLCFIDADGVLCSDWIKKIKGSLKEEKVDAVAGLNVFEHQNVVKKVWYNTYTLFAYLGLFFSNLLFKRLFLSGNNVVIKKSLFFKMGGFEPVVGEDVWLSKRFWAVGGKGVFNPKMIVYYSSRGFDKNGYLRTIIYWIASTAIRRTSKGYSYKSKTIGKGGEWFVKR